MVMTFLSSVTRDRDPPDSDSYRGEALGLLRRQLRGGLARRDIHKRIRSLSRARPVNPGSEPFLEGSKGLEVLHLSDCWQLCRLEDRSKNLIRSLRDVDDQCVSGNLQRFELAA